MGTRSLTHVKQGDQILVTIYRQYDGYLTGQGQDILSALGGRTLVNGVGMDATACMNGMGCVAAMLISFMKCGIVANPDTGKVTALEPPTAGGVYIETPGASDCGEEFTYTISGDTFAPGEGLSLRVDAYGETVYDGPLSGFDPVALESGLNG